MLFGEKEPNRICNHPDVRVLRHQLRGQFADGYVLFFGRPRNLKTLQQTGLRIVRTTTDDGTRLVGVNISAQCVREIQQYFGMWKCTASTADEILQTVNNENQSIDLLGDIKIRRTRFQGVSVTFADLLSRRTIQLSTPRIRDVFDPHEDPPPPTMATSAMRLHAFLLGRESLSDRMFEGSGC